MYHTCCIYQVYKWRFSVDRKRSRTAAQLLGRNTWQHSSEMWITCTVAIHLVRQLDLICLLICNVPHAQSSDAYRKRAYWQWMQRKCYTVVTFAYIHVTGTENQITCTPAIHWVMKVYVNGLLIYNVPHLLYLSVDKWRFSVNRKWSRTAAQLLGRNKWQHSSEIWITWTVTIRLVRQLDLICLLICNVLHAHSTDVYRKPVHIGSKCWEYAAESLHLHICM